MTSFSSQQLARCALVLQFLFVLAGHAGQTSEGSTSTVSAPRSQAAALLKEMDFEFGAKDNYPILKSGNPRGRRGKICLEQTTTGCIVSIDRVRKPDKVFSFSGDTRLLALFKFDLGDYRTGILTLFDEHDLNHPRCEISDVAGEKDNRIDLNVIRGTDDGYFLIEKGIIDGEGIRDTLAVQYISSNCVTSNVPVADDGGSAMIYDRVCTEHPKGRRCERGLTYRIDNQYFVMTWSRKGLRKINLETSGPSNACSVQTTADGSLISNVGLMESPDMGSRTLRALPQGIKVKVFHQNLYCSTIEGKKGRWVKVDVRDEAFPNRGWIFDPDIKYD